VEETNCRRPRIQGFCFQSVARLEQHHAASFWNVPGQLPAQGALTREGMFKYGQQGMLNGHLGTLAMKPDDANAVEGYEALGSFHFLPRF
jgi:hypothetical protein